MAISLARPANAARPSARSSYMSAIRDDSGIFCVDTAVLPRRSRSDSGWKPFARLRHCHAVNRNIDGFPDGQDAPGAPSGLTMGIRCSTTYQAAGGGTMLLLGKRLASAGSVLSKSVSALPVGAAPPMVEIVSALA
ncbi:hypothetical protein MHAS44199_02180 [Mycolicibacterium hassiacum DSM 44199]|nr:hypothetical protein [Mycolicibacterium hassiacum DSM 44199]